jgi:hypothetical protein
VPFFTPRWAVRLYHAFKTPKQPAAAC